MDIKLKSSLLKEKMQVFFLFLKSHISKIRTAYLLYFLIIQVFIIIVFFLVLGLLPVINEIEKYSTSIDSSQIVTLKDIDKDIFEKYSQLVRLKREEDFLKAQISLAKTDSIYLLVNLNDSTVKLMVKGVLLSESKIKKFSINNGAKKMPDHFYNSIFNKPLQTISDFSTIQKFPIVVKKAPRDTTDAKLAEKAPEPPKTLDVFYTLELNENISLEIKQLENDSINSPKLIRRYKRLKTKKALRESIDIYAENNPPFYNYKIELEIPKEDARSIYRALPLKPQVLIRFR